MTRVLLSVVFCVLLAIMTGCGTSTPYVAPPAGDPPSCEVHRVPMRWDKVGIWYGLPVNEYFDAREAFPHSARGRCGGCVVLDKKYSWGWVCNVCTSKEDEWIAGRSSKNSKSH